MKLRWNGQPNSPARDPLTPGEFLCPRPLGLGVAVQTSAAPRSGSLGSRGRLFPLDTIPPKHEIRPAFGRADSQFPFRFFSVCDSESVRPEYLTHPHITSIKYLVLYVKGILGKLRPVDNLWRAYGRPNL